MRHIQLGRPLPLGAPHTIPMRTGHYRLADGSLLRVDIELGRCVGRHYTAQMHVKTQIRGSSDKVHAWVDEIAGRYSVAAPETYRWE